MKRTVFALAALLFLASAASAGQASGALPPVVAVDRVGQADNLEIRRYTGRVVQAASVNLVARVSGELLRMNFREGQIVEQGQILYELDPVRYQAEVQNAEARVEENRARVSYAEITRNRNRNLFEQRATSRDNLDSTESEYAAVLAALKASEAQLITVKDDLANTVIVAPITGKIGVSNFTVGNFLTTESGTIATIIQMDPMRVHFAISNRDYLAMFGSERRLRDHAVIRLRLADDSVYDHEGRIEFIDNQANARTDSVQLYASFANPDYKLFPGGTVTVLLSRRLEGQLSAVTPSAVMHDGETAYVFVLDGDNRIERRDVVLGQFTDNRQLIRSGLAPGESVVVDGMHKAMPGMVVEPAFVGAAAAEALPKGGEPAG